MRALPIFQEGTRGRFQRRLLGAVLLLITALIPLVDYRLSNPPDHTLDRIRQTKIIIIGIDPSYPPFADGKNGAPVGLDVDIANAVAARLGVKVQFRLLGFDGLYDALRVGEVDALISALSFDASKLGDVLYSREYFDSGAVLVSRSGQFQAMRDLEGRSAAVEYGTTADETLQLWQRRLHRIDRLPFETSNEALDAVRAGKADAAIVDHVTALLALRTSSDLIIARDPVAPDPMVIAVRLRSVDLIREINTALDAIDQDGTLEQILHRWL